MTSAMVGAAVYIAMVGGGGIDVWRRSRRLGNRVSLMWAAYGRTNITLCHLKLEQSPAPGNGAGGADRFGRKACAGEGGGLGGPGRSDSCLAVGRSSSRTCWLASELAELNDDNQTMDVASDQEPAPLSKPLHAMFTIEQVRPHFETLIVEDLPTQEDLCCNLRLLNKHR